MKIRNTTSRGKHLKGVIIEGGEETEVEITPKEFKELGLKSKGLEAVEKKEEKEETVAKKKGD